MMRPGEKPTLHEILMAEKMDFEAKVQRAAKRKRWLKGKGFLKERAVILELGNLIFL